jgi:hypothetical protein
VKLLHLEATAHEVKAPSERRARYRKIDFGYEVEIVDYPLRVTDHPRKVERHLWKTRKPEECERSICGGSCRPGKSWRCRRPIGMRSSPPFKITAIRGKVTAVGKPVRIASETAQVSGGAERILQNPELPRRIAPSLDPSGENAIQVAFGSQPDFPRPRLSADRPTVCRHEGVG